MRRYVFGFILLLALTLVETSLLPPIISGSARPSLVLIFTSVWTAICGAEGYVWAFTGGFMLDLISSLPAGLYSASLLIGNLAATLLDRAPIPSPSVRAAAWVAMVTITSNAFILAGLAISGTPVDILYATTNIILPLAVINPLLAVPIYPVLNRIHLLLRTRERR